MAKELTTVRIVATNNGRGPRGINTAAGGTVVVDRGASSPEIEVATGELASIRVGGEFSIEEKGPGATVIRQVAAPRASRIKTLWDDVAKLKAEVAEIRLQLPGMATITGATGAVTSTPTVAQVLAMADDRDVPFLSFKSAASKLLGDATPSRKDDIVAALMALPPKA